MSSLRDIGVDRCADVVALDQHILVAKIKIVYDFSGILHNTVTVCSGTKNMCDRVVYNT